MGRWRSESSSPTSIIASEQLRLPPLRLLLPIRALFPLSEPCRCHFRRFYRYSALAFVRRCQNGRCCHCRGRVSPPVANRAPKAGSCPGNRGVPVNLAVESMGWCQFRCRDYAFDAQIARSRSHRGARSRSRHPNCHCRRSASVGTADGPTYANMTRLLGVSAVQGHGFSDLCEHW